MGWLGGNDKQAKKAAKAQHKYDLAKWKYDWQQMQDDYAYQHDAWQIQVDNAEEVRQWKNQIATNEWVDKDRMRIFDYNNQVSAYNASVQSYETQLDYNNLALELTTNDNTRKYNERQTQIGFQNEELLMKLDDSVTDTGVALRGATADFKKAANELGRKSDDIGQKTLQAKGKQLALGQTGRSARKGLQSILAQQGEQQNALVDLIQKEESSYGLKFEQITNSLTKTQNQTAFGQRQLKESLKSATAQYDSDQQNAALQKYSADLGAEAQLAPEPVLSPQMSKPIDLPKPEILPPKEPPTEEQWETIRPIKGAVSKTSTMSKIAGVASTALTIAKLFSMSDDRLKYDITRVGTSQSGIPKYTFRYRQDGRHGPKYIGTSAQDLISMGRSDAVVQKEKDGFYAVDYSKLDISMEVVTT
jgi:hypothetical protein